MSFGKYLVGNCIYAGKWGLGAYILAIVLGMPVIDFAVGAAAFGAVFYDPKPRVISRDINKE